MPFQSFFFSNNQNLLKYPVSVLKEYTAILYLRTFVIEADGNLISNVTRGLLKKIE